MNDTHFSTPEQSAQLTALYRTTLLEDVIPFWLKHGLDREHGGIMTALDRDGSVLVVLFAWAELLAEGAPLDPIEHEHRCEAKDVR